MEKAEEPPGGAIERHSIASGKSAFMLKVHDTAHSLYKYILEQLLRQKPLSPSKDGRHIPLRAVQDKLLVDERRGHAYISNVIRSSRYTIWDFLPKQLFFQATRLSNFYFICIGVPQTIPGISTTGNFTTIIPLLFFILLTVAKEGYDDYKRHRLDKAENKSQAILLTPEDHLERRLRRWTSFSHWRRPSRKQKVVFKEPASEDGSLQWTGVEWRDIKVGDVLKVRRDEPIPADIVLLHAHGENGLAYIETMALDGETNLKSRQALPALKFCGSIEEINPVNAEFILEDPNRDLYSFDGKVTIDGKSLPLTLNEVILRGCTLRNTGYVVGMVINTGEECKIRMNANHHPRAKKPRLEKFANQAVLTLIVYVILLSGGLSGGYAIWQHSTEKHAFYIEDAPVGFQRIIIGFAIMFNNVIPLALYVSLEIVKIGQMLMVNADVEMYDEESNTRMQCNTNTILENLGQVSYVLSDKTGTLTENVMKFRKISVAGKPWVHDMDPREPKGAEKRISQRTANTKKAVEGPQITVTAFDESSEDSSSASQLEVSDLTPQTADLVKYINRHPDSSFSLQARDFLLGIALCHTCLPETRDGAVDYQAASPDELALVRAAHELGYAVIERSLQSITLSLRNSNGTNTRETYEVLDIIEFSSMRKRMSIILRRPDGRIWLICKGADSAIMPLLRQAPLASMKANEVLKSVELEREMHRKSAEHGMRNSLGARVSLDVRRGRLSGSDLAAHATRPNPIRAKSFDVAKQGWSRATSLDIRPVSLDVARGRTPAIVRLPLPTRSSSAWLEIPSSTDEGAIFKRTFEDLNSYAAEGLRTLLFAHKFIPANEYEEWKKAYHDATTAITDRQEKIESAGELIERSFELLGASAIEDKLQQGVPETIEKLRRANIRIWMLTGDKRETAISIAHSARICRPDSDLFILDASKGDLEAQMRATAQDTETLCTHSVAVIDGNTLGVVEADPSLKQMFYALIPSVDSVICCRASPAQKASVVKAIRANINGVLTLAIGDGSNDIAMIQASHVGVGISGKEGLQAYRAADYSIAQFRFLQRLLLVHGRWNYIRTAKFILLTFWKEMFFYTMQALYQRYNGYTGTSLYESWSLTVLNTLFTSLCVIVPGIFEQDLSAETLLAVPELYAYGQRNMGLNLRKYIVWMIGATATGIAVWFVCWAAYGTFDLMGDQGLFALGDLVFSVAIVWTNWKLFLIETHHKTTVVLVCFLITFSGWWAWNGFLASAYDPMNRWPYSVRDGFTKTFGRDPQWWLTLIAAIAILAVADPLYKLTWRHLESAGLLSWLRLDGTGDGSAEIRPEIWQELEQDSSARSRWYGLEADESSTACSEKEKG